MDISFIESLSEEQFSELMQAVEYERKSRRSVDKTRTATSLYDAIESALTKDWKIKIVCRDKEVDINPEDATEYEIILSE